MKFKNKFNLQFFNDGEPTPPAEPVKTFTQDQVNKMFQERLSKEKAKLNREMESKITEATNLLQMSAEERVQHELKKREASLIEREAAIEHRELQNKGLDMLAEKGLHSRLIEVLSFSDEESLTYSIESLEKTFKEAINLEVDKRLPSTDPQVSNNGRYETDSFLKGLKKR